MKLDSLSMLASASAMSSHLSLPGAASDWNAASAEPKRREKTSQSASDICENR